MAQTSSDTRPKIITICGPSGSGKTTLSRTLLSQGAMEIVSTTTRAPRPNEVEGRDYYFSTPEQFSLDVENGEFIENATFGKNMYGVKKDSVTSILDAGKTAVAVLEINGVLAMREAVTKGELGNVELVSVFIEVPTSEAERRLRNRGDNMNEDTMAWRVSHIAEEAKNIKYFSTPDSIILKHPSLSELPEIAQSLLGKQPEQFLDVSMYSGRIKKLYENWCQSDWQLPKEERANRDAIFQMAIQMDPTPGQKMVGWILDSWIGGDPLVRTKQIDKVRSIIETFDACKKQLPENQRTLLFYDGPQHMDGAIAPFRGYLGARQKKKAISRKAHLESWNFSLPSGVQVAVPISEDAAKLIGQGTKWCTAAKNNNLYDVYSDATLFAIQTAEDKYQVAFSLEELLKNKTLSPADIIIKNSADADLDENDVHIMRSHIRELLQHIERVGEIQIKDMDDIVSGIFPEEAMREPVKKPAATYNLSAALAGMTEESEDCNHILDQVNPKTAVADLKKILTRLYEVNNQDLAFKIVDEIPMYWRDEFPDVPPETILETMDSFIRFSSNIRETEAIHNIRQDIILSNAYGLLDYDAFLRLDPGIDITKKYKNERDIAREVSENIDVFCTSQKIPDTIWTMCYAMSGENPQMIRRDSDVVKGLSLMNETQPILEKALISNATSSLIPDIIEKLEQDKIEPALTALRNELDKSIGPDLSEQYMNRIQAVSRKSGLELEM